jgi:hypothetical protein
VPRPTPIALTIAVVIAAVGVATGWFSVASVIAVPGNDVAWAGIVIGCLLVTFAVVFLRLGNQPDGNGEPGDDQDIVNDIVTAGIAASLAYVVLRAPQTIPIPICIVLALLGVLFWALVRARRHRAGEA